MDTSGSSSGWATPSIGRDLLVVGLAAFGAVAVTHTLPSAVTVEDAYEVLTLAAAAAGVAAAIFADLAARLHDTPRMAWCGAAFAVYSLVVVPSTVLGAHGSGLDLELKGMRLVAYLTVLALLVLAAQPSRRGGAWGGWVIAGGGTALALASGGLLSIGPHELVRLLLDASVGYIALAGWCWVAAVYLQRAVRLGQPALWRIGIGVGVLASAQIYRVAAGITPARPDLGYGAMRLVGLAVVVVGFAGFWLYVLRSARQDRERQADELRIAEAHLRRAADSGARRDHELRNGIGGLIGITALLSAPETERNEPLRSAVLAELGRLSRMVDGGLPDDPTGADVGRALADLAALRVGLGTRITVEAPDGLHADVPESVLRQVLTNLVVNAERHAPGSPVRLSARREGALAVIEVRDRGPGVPPGREEEVFAAGVHDADAGGSGLGLDICRELVTEHGGTIVIRPFDDTHPGCVVGLTFMACCAPPGAGAVPEPRPDRHPTPPSPRR